MRPVVATDSPQALSEVEIRVHKGIGADEPGVDVVNCVVHIDVGPVDDPGKSVVKDGIGHGLEISGIVDQSNVRVELAITRHICTLSVDCERRQKLWNGVNWRRAHTLFLGEHGGVSHIRTIWPPVRCPTHVRVLVSCRWNDALVHDTWGGSNISTGRKSSGLGSSREVFRES